MPAPSDIAPWPLPHSYCTQFIADSARKQKNPGVPTGVSTVTHNSLRVDEHKKTDPRYRDRYFAKAALTFASSLGVTLS